MIANALNDKPLPVYGTGENVRDWLYVEDHCRAIDLIIHNGRVGEVYNHVRMFFFEEFVNCFTVCDAFFHETEIRVVHNRSKSGKVSCVCQAVQTDDTIVRVFL